MKNKKSRRKFLFVYLLVCIMLVHPVVVSANDGSVMPRLAVGYKWQLPAVVTFSYDGTDLNDNGSTNDERTAILEAMVMWNEVDHASTNASLVSFSLTTATSSNEIKCKDASYGYIAKTEPTYNQSNSSIIVGADILLNTFLGWSPTGAWPKYDVWTLVGHELGHVLGVAHCHQSSSNIEDEVTSDTECVSSTCDSNIMKPKISGGEKIHTLTAYDKSSYQLIYY